MTPADPTFMQHTLFYVPLHKRKLQNNDTKKLLPRFRRHSSCWLWQRGFLRGGFSRLSVEMHGQWTCLKVVGFQNNFFRFSSSKIQFTVNVAIICYSLQWDDVDGCAVLNCKTISIVSIITVIMPSRTQLNYIYFSTIFMQTFITSKTTICSVSIRGLASNASIDCNVPQSWAGKINKNKSF